jgi:malate dehydrogenase (oxaloacetate-decarboxylating)
MAKPKIAPSPCYSYTLRLEIENESENLGSLLSAIGKIGGQVRTVDLVETRKTTTIRDLSYYASSEEEAEEILTAVKSVKGIRLLKVHDTVFDMHIGGKIEISNKAPLNTREALSMAYTPGVARVCMAIHEKPELAYDLTIKNNMVAVVSDGTAVLGLGDIGPEAAMPVMEGKAMLFKEFGGVDAFPICLNTKDVARIIDVVEAIAPGFGGINLEDISAPRCFEIEETLKKRLDIPVFHDDQHGTAVVVMAALINALKLTGRKAKDLKVIVSGVGAAGVACSKIMMDAGVSNIIGCDRSGAIYRGRTENMNSMKQWFAENTNFDGFHGELEEAARGADLFLGLSGPGVFSVKALRSMNEDPIIFAMANPVPEIMPEEAAPYARIIATGRSDYANQINNVLGFPGIFRGALDVRAREINEAMKMAAARAIASTVSDGELSEEYIIPSVFNKQVAPAVAKAVADAARQTGVARKT